MVAITDRSGTSDRKSLSNRQRFIERNKQQIRKQVGESIGDISIDSMRGRNGTYRVPIRGTKEPAPHQDRRTGNHDFVIPGKGDVNRHDTFDKPQQGGGSGGREGSPDGEGQDDYAFNLTYEEFLEFFMADLELPDMIKKSGESEVEFKSRRAGYSTSGALSNLDVGVTIKQSLARKIALGRPSKQTIAELEAALAAAETDEDRAAAQQRLDAALLRQRRVPWVADIDLRFKAFTQEPVPTTHAVMFCVMDVSASMGEHEKDLAKRFMLLLNLLLHKKYQKVEVVFVRFHTHASECSEDEFFKGQETGGTNVLPAVKLVEQILTERYSQDWNCYLAMASDGDGWGQDLRDTEAKLREMLKDFQYCAYLETSERDDSGMWEMFDTLQEKHEHVQMRRTNERSEIWPLFRELYKKVS